MSTISALMEGASVDLRTLARQYAELTHIKVKDSGQALFVAAVWVVACTVFAAFTALELVFALAIWLVNPDAIGSMRTCLVAACLTLALALVAALVGRNQVKKIDVDPRTRKDIGLKEDASWQQKT